MWISEATENQSGQSMVLKRVVLDFIFVRLAQLAILGNRCAASGSNKLRQGRHVVPTPSRSGPAPPNAHTEACLPAGDNEQGPICAVSKGEAGASPLPQKRSKTN